LPSILESTGENGKNNPLSVRVSRSRDQPKGTLGPPARVHGQRNSNREHPIQSLRSCESGSQERNKLMVDRIARRDPGIVRQAARRAPVGDDVVSYVPSDFHRARTREPESPPR